MPRGVMKQLATKAAKTLGAAMKYWDKGKEQAEQGNPATEAAYILGVAKKRLGLTDADLLTFGADVNLVFEASAAAPDLRVDTSRVKDIDKTLAAAFVAEFTKVDTEAGSALFENGDDGFELKEEFAAVITESATESSMKAWWTKVFMNAPEILLDYLAKTTSGN